MAYDTGVYVPFPQTPIPLMFFEVPKTCFTSSRVKTTGIRASLRERVAFTFSNGDSSTRL